MTRYSGGLFSSYALGDCFTGGSQKENLGPVGNSDSVVFCLRDRYKETQTLCKVTCNVFTWHSFEVLEKQRFHKLDLSVLLGSVLKHVSRQVRFRFTHESPMYGRLSSFSLRTNNYGEILSVQQSLLSSPMWVNLTQGYREWPTYSETKT